MTGALIATAAAAAISAAGSVYSGEQQKKAANYNASMQEAQAKATDTQTREAIRRQRVQNQSILAAQRTSALSSGVEESGSSLLTLMENSNRLEKNIADIATQGNAAQYAALNQATLARMQGKTAQTSGYIQAGSTLLSGASSVYGMLKKEEE
jgi:hypothetical protein